MRRSWWVLALRGVLAVTFGLVVFFRPGLTLGEVVLLFGAYVFCDGMAAVASVAWGTAGATAWPILLEGAVSVTLGIVAWVSPAVSPALLYLVATWGIITGILEIVAAARMRRPSTSQWCLALAGVSSVLIGLLLLGLPASGAASVARLLGFYAIVFGALILVAATRLRAGGSAVPLPQG